MLLCSRVLVQYAICKLVDVSGSVVQVLFSRVDVCVILQVYIVVDVIGHVALWLLRDFRSTLGGMSLLFTNVI